MDVSGTIGAILNQKGSQIYSIAPDALVFEAIEMMAAKNVGALLVIRGEELLGIISERDYTRKVFLRGKRSRETRVEEIMSRDVTITSPNEPVERCMRLMTETVLPPTIVRTARPFSFQPSNGVLRDCDSLVLAIHSISGSISVMSAFTPIDNVPASIFSNLAGSSVNISINRFIEIAFRLCTRISMNNPSSVSSPTIPNGA